MCEIFTSRRDFVKKTSEMLQQCKSDALLMGRHIAWISQEKEFADAIRIARSKGVVVRVLSVKLQTANEYTEEFEKLGCPVRFYDHGDIRVLIFDRSYVLMGIPSDTTLGYPHVNREYVAVGFSEEPVVMQFYRRFEEMWEKGERREKEPSPASTYQTEFLRRILHERHYEVLENGKLRMMGNRFNFVATKDRDIVLTDIAESAVNQSLAEEYILKVTTERHYNRHIRCGILVAPHGADQFARQSFQRRISDNDLKLVLVEELDEGHLNDLL